MASGKAILGEVFGKWFLREATVAHVRDLAPRFREITLAGRALEGVRWTPGDKVQVFIADVGMRTYTPVAWDPAAGTTRFVVYMHGRAPGADLARDAKAGDVWRFFGPRGSLSIVDGGAPAVLFGDETSFGVARTVEGSGAPTCVFEVDDAAVSETVLSAIGVGKCTVIARSDSGAHFDAVAEALITAVRAHTGARLLLSGRAQSIQEVRKRLRAAGGVSAAQTKAYWAVGKRGLD